MRLLVTGFDAFGGSAINASEQVAIRLNSNYATFEIVSAILPTSYSRAASKFLEAKDKLNPDAALCLGEAVGRPCINVEQLAYNFADSKRADNDGLVLQNHTLDPKGEPSYQTHLATDLLVKAAIDAGVPATVSQRAGSFVCNAFYFKVLKDIASANFPVCFIHLPGLPEAVLDRPQLPSMSLELSRIGIEAICTEIVTQIAQR